MKLLLWLTVLSIAPPIGARAQSFTPAHVVHDLPGYTCMSLNLSERQMMDPSVHVPILTSPFPNAAPIGDASAIVVVASPERPENGYVQVLHLNGRTGWISSQFLKPWSNPGYTGDHCYPSLMSNGRIGFDFHR